MDGSDPYCTVTIDVDGLEPRPPTADAPWWVVFDIPENAPTAHDCDGFDSAVLTEDPGQALMEQFTWSFGFGGDLDIIMEITVIPILDDPTDLNYYMGGNVESDFFADGSWERTFTLGYRVDPQFELLYDENDYFYPLLKTDVQAESSVATGYYEFNVPYAFDLDL